MGVNGDRFPIVGFFGVVVNDGGTAVEIDDQLRDSLVKSVE